MHYQVMDYSGRQALIRMDQVKWSVSRLSRHMMAVRVYETGEDLKAPPRGFYWQYQVPTATEIKARLRGGAREFMIGYETPQGFSIPSSKTINALYVRNEA